LKQLLTGDAKAGEAFFNGAGGCSSCHSPSRNLAGIAKKYQPAELQARFLYPSEVPKKVTVTTHSGQRITGELVYKDAFSIAIQDQDGWYRSWPCDDVKFEIHDPVEAHLELLHKYTEADMHNVFAYLETLK
jgi:cytochrome c oxidase cbb3-type subunit 3